METIITTLKYNDKLTVVHFTLERQVSKTVSIYIYIPMNTFTPQGKNGIKWTTWIHLDDYDFTDDLIRPSYTQ